MRVFIRFGFCLILTLFFTCTGNLAHAQALSISDPGLDAAIRDALRKPNGPLSAQDLLSLTNLDASSRNISSVAGLEAAGNLVTLNLEDNSLTSFTLPASLTKLNLLDLNFNESLTNFTLPSGMTNLTSLFLVKNQLTDLELPADLVDLVQIDATENELASFTLPAGLTNLSILVLDGNLLTNFTLPPDQTKLASLSLEFNNLTNFILPAGLTNLSVLGLAGNHLTNFTLPPDQTELISLSLTAVFFDGTRLATFVLSEPLAATNMAETVAFLRSQGVLVLTYPVASQLTSPTRNRGGLFEFTLTGPPGDYTILSSTNLTDWSELGVVTNTTGVSRFGDDAAPLSPQKFYRARQTSPAN